MNSLPDAIQHKSFYIITFGCQMNLHDSEVAEGLLLQAGYHHAQEPESADIVLFNTCCVRDHAEQRLYSRLSQLKGLKDKKPEMLIGVGGCVAQKEKGNLPAKFPHIDIVFGTNAVQQIASLVEQAGRQQRPIIAAPEDGPALRTDEYAHRDGRLHAWVSIMRGCDNFCSYCIVPYVRGPQRSKTPAEVFDEVRRLAHHRVKEITLLGQNVNSYGQDLSDSASFSDLLGELDKIQGLLRIRFTTSHPKDISENLMRAIRDLPTVCEHLHLPIQSGSSRILQLMNRKYTAEKYIETVNLLREFIPEIALTTDVIVGFPGESEEDFSQTRSLLERVQFDGAYIFKYSPRQGTAAARMNGGLSREVIKRRHQELLDLQKTISREKLNKLLNTTQAVLTERADPKRPGHLVGRTRGHSTAVFPGPNPYIGKEVSVKIIQVEGWTLLGRAIAEEEICRNASHA